VDYHKLLRKLIAERQEIDLAIRAVEPLARKRQKRRGPGRPPLAVNQLRKTFRGES